MQKNWKSVNCRTLKRMGVKRYFVVSWKFWDNFAVDMQLAVCGDHENRKKKTKVWWHFIRKLRVKDEKIENLSLFSSRLLPFKYINFFNYHRLTLWSDEICDWWRFQDFTSRHNMIFKLTQLVIVMTLGRKWLVADEQKWSLSRTAAACFVKEILTMIMRNYISNDDFRISSK